MPGNQDQAAAIRRGKRLTALLHKELDKAHDVLDDDGSTLTKAEAIIRSIVKDATGWTEKKRDEQGNLQESYHPALSWAKQWVVDRIEGKASAGTADVEPGMKAKDKVRELARQRLNELVPAPKSGPPVHKPKSE